MAAELPRSRTEDGLSVAFELKGSVSPLTVLRLRTTDLEAIEKELRSRIAQLPQMFHNAPVVLDLGALEAVDELAFEGLAGRLRACQMVPVAISNAAAETIARAAAAGFGHLQLGNGRARTRERAPLAVVEPTAVEIAPEPAPVAAEPQVVTAPAPVGPMTIRQPVRGGQVIYARGTDLVILAPVNPGAQVIADGNIHIYAPLRGRALAGAQGNAETRIFCQSLDAELVSVAGEFLTAEDIPAERRRKPSQILLEGGRCKIVAL